MTETGTKQSFIIWLALIQPLVASACPQCNVFNYLCPSVRSSANIVVGVAERTVGDYNTSVRIERVLRGTNTPGSVSTFKAFGMNDSIGERFIFCDPVSEPPTFEALPVEMEWEVSYLTRNVPISTNFWEYDHQEHLEMIPAQLRPRPRHAVEALRAIEGISNVSRESGIEYAKRNRREMYPRIQKQLEQRATEFERPATNRYSAHGIDGLVQAMWLLDETAAGKYFTEDFRRRFGRNTTTLPTNVPSSGTLEGRYVSSVLRQAKDAGKGEMFRRYLAEKLPALRGQPLTTAIYALDYSELATPADLEAAAQRLLVQNPDQQLAVAAGFYQAAVEHANWWAWKKATNELGLARSHCNSPDCEPLAAQIDEEIKRFEKMHRK